MLEIMDQYRCGISVRYVGVVKSFLVESTMVRWMHGQVICERVNLTTMWHQLSAEIAVSAELVPIQLGIQFTFLYYNICESVHMCTIFPNYNISIIIRTLEISNFGGTITIHRKLFQVIIMPCDNVKTIHKLIILFVVIGLDY